ncbi:MAG: thermonuclease family protein [Kiritimatiellia bacterium]
MNTRKKNQLFVTLFLLTVIGFTGLMTFYVGPIMMGVRNQVAQDQVLFKCQKVHSGTEIDVQMRGWERPNPHPVFPVQFAGLDSPPPGGAEDPQLIAWAERHELDPEFAARMGESARKTLVAFIRKQNLFLYREDGTRSLGSLEPESRVHVLVSGTNVNLKQLEHGLAFHDQSRPHAFSDLYAAAEAEAKAAGRGLWANPK